MSYQALQCSFRTFASWDLAVEMSVLFFCVVKPQNRENGVLMKEVACFVWVSSWNELWQSDALFFSRPTLEAEASPDQTQCCSHGGRRRSGSFRSVR